MPPTFDAQGHRGARGLRPENTLPSFEAALDLGVTAIETDLHLSRDGVAVIFHDPRVSERLCTRRAGHDIPDPSARPPVAALTVHQLRGYCAERNPDPGRFPTQEAVVSPLALWFAQEQGCDAYSIPTLDDLFAFAAAYAGEPGKSAGKSDAQREGARRLRFDLELKRVPFDPGTIGDDFNGRSPAALERAILKDVQAAGVLGRTIVRSFDHRCVRVLKEAEPRLEAAVLVAGTAPVEPEQLVRAAGADTYGPEYEYLDAGQVERLHAAGIRVVPWTVNDPVAMRRLLEWRVDGLTTDYPDRLLALSGGSQPRA